MDRGYDSASGWAVELAEDILDEVVRVAPDWGQVAAWATELADLAQKLGPPPPGSTRPAPAR